MIFPYLKPTWYQLASWYAYAIKRRFHLLSIHRRGGKDVCHFSMAAQDAILNGGVHYYLFPTRKWAADVIVNEQFDFGGEKRSFYEWIIPKELNPQWKEKDACIILPHNDARIQLGGTDDESNVGRGGAGYTFSEFSRHKPTATGFIAPIIDQSNAYLHLNGTLMGKDNQLWQMLEANKNDPEWHVQWLRPHQTKCYCWVGDGMNVNPELLSRLGEKGPNFGKIINVSDRIRQKLTSKTLAMQEYLNEPILASDIGYFSNEYEIAKGERRANADYVKYDRNLPVFTFWDLGKGTASKSTDAMVCWFLQFPKEDYPNPKLVHFIDCHESRGYDWAFYAQMLNQKGYWYGGHFAPWDINTGKAGHGMKTNLDFAKERGIDFTPVPRTPAIYNDIELIRRAFSGFHFSTDAQVQKGVDMIAAFREKLNKDGVGEGTPEHDRSSNFAAGLRTFIRAADLQMIMPKDRSTNMFQNFKGLSMDGYFR